MSSLNVGPERLAQIASRKLSQLSVQHAFSSSVSGALEGTLTFTPGQVVNPLNEQPIGRARFATVQHDRLRFLDSPLAALGSFPFLEIKSLHELELAVSAALSNRRHLLKQLQAKLETLKLKTWLEPEALVVLAEVAAPECSFLLEAGTDGVRVRAITEQGRLTKIGDGYSPLALKEFASGVDLELYLCDALPALRAAAATAAPAKQPSPSEQGPTLSESTPPPGAVTVGYLSERFGPGAIIVPGPKVEVTQEFTVGASRFRFAAIQEAGDTFQARLTGPKGIHWQDKIHLAKFPGAAALVSSALGIPQAAQPQPAAPAPAVYAAPAADTPYAPSTPNASPFATEISITPGEVWVMNVMIDAAGDHEVRYACTDINGERYGAIRVLSRADFERIFSPHGGGWRLLIAIDRVEGERVFYRQLSRQRQPLSEPKALSRQVLTSTFIPEVSAY